LIIGWLTGTQYAEQILHTQWDVINKNNKEIEMSDYIEDLLDVGFDDYDDDCDDAVEM